MRHRLLSSKPILIGVLFFLSLSISACAKGKDRKYLLGNLFEVKPPKEGTVMVAVLPVQNATFHPIRITGKQASITKFLEEFLHRGLKFQYNEDDVAYVQKTLQLILTQRLYDHGYRVLAPQEIEAAFAAEGLAKSEQGLNLEDLTPVIPADWMLLVTLTEWEGDGFEKTGKGKYAYQIVLIDTRLKKAIWQKDEKKLRFEAPYRQLPYNRQGGDALNLVAKRMLKDMPKTEAIGAYEEKEKAEEAALRVSGSLETQVSQA